MTESKVLKSLIDFVEKKMKSEGFNQVSLGSAMGLSKQRVNQFITGGHSPRLSTIEALAKAFNLPIFYLFMSESERAIWDAKTAPNSGLESLESRLAKLEAHFSQPSKDQPAPPQVDTIHALEALALEMQRVINAPPLKKHERNKGK